MSGSMSFRGAEWQIEARCPAGQLPRLGWPSTCFNQRQVAHDGALAKSMLENDS